MRVLSCPQNKMFLTSAETPFGVIPRLKAGIHIHLYFDSASLGILSLCPSSCHPCGVWVGFTFGSLTKAGSKGRCCALVTSHRIPFDTSATAGLSMGVSWHLH